MRSLIAALALGLVAGGAQAAPDPPPATTPAKTTASESGAQVLPPGCIQVQHILISFDGAPRIKPPGRTKEQAAALAEKVLKQAQQGADFLALVKQYTSDSAPGIYGMCETEPLAAGFAPRRGMVQGFGDVSFGLQPGQIGMASYDPQRSPYGWHIIKRLK